MIKMKILELFSGTGSFSTVAKERGHEVFTIDFDKQFNPDLCVDIMEVTPEMVVSKLGIPDVIWASPPCQKFSIMRVYQNWEKLGEGKYKPKNPETKKAIKLIKHTLDIISKLHPKIWIIENPRAMLRKQNFMPNNNRKTVTYCKYGFTYQKATDIWTNLNNWQPKEPCSANMPCHVRAPRGSRTGIQGMDGFRENRKQKHPVDISRMNKGHEDFIRRPNWDGKQRALRGMIPPELCLEIIKCCEKVV